MEVNGRYTANWDSLINFINNGKVPILERKEEIIQKAYGGEEVKVHIDTLGFISARDRIFKKNYTMNVADNGIFQGYNVKVGDRVIKNQKAYKLKVGDRETLAKRSLRSQSKASSLTSQTCRLVQRLSVVCY
jgi:hypothetical protein